MSIIDVHDEKVEADITRYSIEHQITSKDEYLNIQIEFFTEKHVPFYTLPGIEAGKYHKC